MTSTAPASPFRHALDAAADAVRFFTRLPIPSGFGSADPVRMFDGIAAAAPMAGLVVGALSGAVLAVCLALGLPPLAAAAFALAAAVALTGALHEDALADMADGFGGGATPEAKLAIMRDSRLGAYGGSALGVALIARAALIAALGERLSALDAGLALAAAAALARPASLVPTLLLPPARSDGAGHAAQPGAGPVAIGCALGAAAALFCAGAAPGVAAILAATTVVLAVTALAKRQIGGVTGDVCGAAAQLAEIVALTALVALSQRMT